LWFDDPMTNTQVTNNIVVDQIADGINFRRGVTGSSARNNFFRKTGEDAMASWSDVDADVGNVFDSNTVQTQNYANFDKCVSSWRRTRWIDARTTCEEPRSRAARGHTHGDREGETARFEPDPAHDLARVDAADPHARHTW
jgi:hypothetical protein